MSIRETLRSWLGFGAGVAMGGFGCNYTPGSSTDAEPEAATDTRPDNFDGGVDAQDGTDVRRDTYESLPDLAPDTTSDTTTCDRTPRVFTGDGTYTIRPGDKVIANNNVSFEIRNGCPDSAIFWADFYIGADRLNRHPFYLSAGPGICTDLYGVTLNENRFGITECGYEADMTVTSLYPGPIESRRNLYEGCRAAGEVHSLCSELIPHEAAPSETVYANERYQAITPADTDPAIGQYYLRQLELAHERLVSLLGISGGAGPISLRVYRRDTGNPTSGEVIYRPLLDNELDTVRAEESSGLAAIASNSDVIINLGLLMTSGIRLPFWMNAGLSKYSNVYATDRNVEHRPFFEGTFPLDSDIEIPGRPSSLKPRFSDYDERTGFVFERVRASWFNAKSHSIYASSLDYAFLLSVENVNAAGVTVRAFQDGPFERSRGWLGGSKATCFDSGYTENPGMYINGDFYKTALPSIPGAQPYTSLGVMGFTPDFYSTAYCFLDGIRQLYGRDVMPRFLQAVEAGRETHGSECPPSFCALPALEAATGADLTEYFRRFDVPVTGDCYPVYETTEPVFHTARLCAE